MNSLIRYQSSTLVSLLTKRTPAAAGCDSPDEENGCLSESLIHLSGDSLSSTVGLGICEMIQRRAISPQWDEEAFSDEWFSNGSECERETSSITSVALAHSICHWPRVLWRLLRIRLHRTACTTAEPPASFFEYQHRPASGRL